MEKERLQKAKRAEDIREPEALWLMNRSDKALD